MCKDRAVGFEIACGVSDGFGKGHDRAGGDAFRIEFFPRAPVVVCAAGLVAFVHVGRVGGIAQLPAPAGLRAGDDLDMAGGVFNGQVRAADRRRQGIDAVGFEAVQIAPECFDFEVADAVAGQRVRFAFDVFVETRFVGFVEDVVVVVGNAVICAVQAQGVVAEDDVGVFVIRADIGFVAAVSVRRVGGQPDAALELCFGGKGFLAGNGLVVGEGDFEVGGRGGGAGLVDRGFDGFGGWRRCLRLR